MHADLDTLCTTAMTEPEAGSEVASVSISAQRVDGGFVLNCQKVLC